MASTSQRAFALTIALIFLVTTVATSVFVVMAIVDENKNKNATTSTTDSTKTQDTATTKPQEGKLEGTKLKDFTATEDRASSIQSTDITPGNGAVVKKGDKITAHYTGAVVKTGLIFQSSLDSGSPFNATLLTPEENNGQGLIAGWVEGIPGMKVGGTRRLVIPANKAYGAQGSPPAIPADADLVFDIQLVAIN